MAAGSGWTVWLRICQQSPPSPVARTRSWPTQPGSRLPVISTSTTTATCRVPIPLSLAWGVARRSWRCWVDLSGIGKPLLSLMRLPGALARPRKRSSTRTGLEGYLPAAATLPVAAAAFPPARRLTGLRAVPPADAAAPFAARRPDGLALLGFGFGWGDWPAGTV